jgi:putative ABC transport system permease protein
MLKNYLKVILRNISRNKLHTFINVFGLGIALACCIVAYLNWEYNNTFDAYHEQGELIYRVNFVRIANGEPTKNGSCPWPLGSAIRENIEPAQKVVRYYPVNGSFKFEDEVFTSWVAAVDPEFFEIFKVELLAGDRSLIRDKTTIFISTNLAEKYFPQSPNPVGEIITYINGEIRIEFKIGGVFKKPPQNTSFFSEAFINYANAIDITGWEENNWTQFNTTFIKLASSDDVPKVEQQMKNFVEIQNRAKEDYKVDHYYLDRFSDMAVRAEKEEIWNHWLNQSLPVSAVLGPGIMAIFTLLIACFNFTNTSIAIAHRRTREIGIRKVMGSRKPQIVVQFLLENILLSFLALLLGLFIATFLVPAYSALWPFLEINLNIGENLSLIGFLVLLLLFTGLLAGSYPAFYMSSFQPAIIFRGTVKFRGSNIFTGTLLTLQYAISLSSIVLGFIFVENANYQKNYDMGFSMENVLIANVKNESGFTAMHAALSDNSMIKNIAGSSHSATSYWYTDPIKFEALEMDAYLMDIGANYLKTVGATIIEGRDFIANSQNDVEHAAIVNEKLVQSYNWQEAIGKRILLRDTVELFVVGVVRNMYIDGELWDPVEPMLLRLVPKKDYRYISVSAEQKNIEKVKELMVSSWKSIFPDELPAVDYMADERADSVLVNKNIKSMFVFLGIITTILSSIGLFSLVSLTVVRRMKEVGVRKVLGASVFQITQKLSREFVIMLSLSSILGSFIAYISADLLMSSIWTYHVPIGAGAFLVSIAILLVVGGATIGIRVFQAANTNPVNTLRNE